MKKILPFWTIVLLFALFAFGLCDNAGAKEATQAVVSIEKAQLVGSWQCTKFIFDNGMENPMMAKHEPMLTFNGNGTVISGTRTYQYEINGNQVLFSHNGQPVGKPYLYDGESLVLQGDNAKVFYEKKK